MNAIEISGTVDGHRQLHLDKPLPMSGPTRVRVIVLFSDANDIDEPTWLKAATANPAFAFLEDDKENLYTSADGQPFHDQR